MAFWHYKTSITLIAAWLSIAKQHSHKAVQVFSAKTNFLVSMYNMELFTCISTILCICKCFSGAGVSAEGCLYHLSLCDIVLD